MIKHSHGCITTVNAICEFARKITIANLSQMISVRDIIECCEMVFTKVSRLISNHQFAHGFLSRMGFLQFGSCIR